MTVPDYISTETVLETQGADIYDYDPCAPTMLQYYIPLGHTLHHTSRRNGYLPKGKVAVIPYSGKFGSGVILATFYNLSKVLMLYYIDRGGEQKDVNNQK